MPIDRANAQQVKAMDDPASFAAEAAAHVQKLVTKTKGALSTMFGLVFPKLPQNKTLEEMAQAFIISEANKIEVFKRTSRILGGIQLEIGHRGPD